MNLSNLCGYRLVDIDKTGVTVGFRGEETFKINFVEDEGGCCGWNTIETALLIDRDDPSRNPVIVKVERVDEDADGFSTCKITFFGESAPIAKLCTKSSSGSEWRYGAHVCAVCKAPEINDLLSEW